MHSFKAEIWVEPTIGASLTGAMRELAQIPIPAFPLQMKLADIHRGDSKFRCSLVETTKITEVALNRIDCGKSGVLFVCC